MIYSFILLALLVKAGPDARGDDLTVDSFAAFAGQSNILLQAAGNVIFIGGTLNLPSLAPGVTGLLQVQAGSSIMVEDGTSLNAGNNWSINLRAGTNFVATPTQPSPASGNYGIYLDGAAFLQAQNGNITFWAANEVQVGWLGSSSGAGVLNSGTGSVTTLAGGNITVTAAAGDINTGDDVNGYVFGLATAPYYRVNAASLGGISTAAGGNVTLMAGGNVISYLPTQNDYNYNGSRYDGGTGAFGPQPGNVTVTAGGNVSGDFVLANGAGTIKASGNIGVPITDTVDEGFALSLVKGSWSVYANNIYLADVLNPNGVFNDSTTAKGRAGAHLFDYDPQASLLLAASNSVTITGVSVPLLPGSDLHGQPIPVLLPPVLSMVAGNGGVTLDANATLFPSPFQNLDITTTGGGNLAGLANSPSTKVVLSMSDSAQSQWVANNNTFGVSDHAATAALNAAIAPVDLNISGSMENLTLLTSRATHITVGGDLTGCGFSGQNLLPGDITSITVAGQLFNQSAYSWITLGQPIPGLPTADLPPGSSNTWATVLTAALNPAAIASLPVPGSLSPSQWAAYALTSAAWFQSNPGFIYDPGTRQLGFGGPMTSSVLSGLAQPMVVLRYDTNGLPVTYAANGTTYFATDQVNWVPTTVLQTLYTESQGASSPAVVDLGFRIGGPGQFVVNAGSISLGNTYGILSCGVADPAGGFGRYGNLVSLTQAGASVNVTVAGELVMPASTIATLGGGDVAVTGTGSLEVGRADLPVQRREVSPGIFTSGAGNVALAARGDIDIAGSCVGAFDGGNVSVVSLAGNVNAGTGWYLPLSLIVDFVNPVTGQAAFYQEASFGGGIMAETLTNPAAVPNSALQPGNITVESPEGSISTSQGGILQVALNGAISAYPTINLIAGGNIYLGDAGVIGDRINLNANGSISGTIVDGGVPPAFLSVSTGALFLDSSNQISVTNLTAVAGAGLALTVVASGIGPCFYQWFANGVPQPGQTNTALWFQPVLSGNAGNYAVVVSNYLGSVTNNIQLHVLPPPMLSAAMSPDGSELSVSFSETDLGALIAQSIPAISFLTSSDLVNWTVFAQPATANSQGGLTIAVPVTPDASAGFYKVLIQSQ